MFMKLLDKCNELGILDKSTFYLDLGWGEIYVEDHFDGEFAMTMPLYYFATSFLKVINLMAKCDKRLQALEDYVIDLPENFDDPNVTEIPLLKRGEEFRYGSLVLDVPTPIEQCALKITNHFEPVDDDDEDDEDNDKNVKRTESVHTISLNPDGDSGDESNDGHGELTVQCMKLITIYVLKKETINITFNKNNNDKKKGKPKK